MKFKLARRGHCFLAAILAAPLACAGPDDDARFNSDGITRNSVDPIQTGGQFADYPTNADVDTGLRLFPPTHTQLITGQRFDLRVETQIPTVSALPALKQLTVNGTDITAAFLAKIAAQGGGPESGRPTSPQLYGATARNLSFAVPGVYTVTATVNVDGFDRTVTNVYPVAYAPKKPRLKHVVFFLGDAMGLPVRTAARLYSKNIVEGRTQGKLFMDSMDEYGLVQTASFDSLITDSAPGMANYLSGMKQPNNALNVSADNTPEENLDNPRIETLPEYVKRNFGWKTGVVTDAFVTDATPAAAAVHSRARSARTAIAQQMLDYYKDGNAQPETGYAALRELTQPLDVIIGAGAKDWLSSSNADLKSFYQYASGGRSDEDLFATVAPGLGYATARNLSELNAASDNKPLLAIFTGEFRTTSTGLGPDNVPGALDRLLARGQVTIRGKNASAPEVGMNVAPPQGAGCGATVKDCFASVPSKREMVQKAIAVLNHLAGTNGGWLLLVEQSQIDKLAHPLEYERVAYEALELDETLGWVMKNVSGADRLVLVTADHAQPETIIGVALPEAIKRGGATPPGACFTASADNEYPITLGGSGDTERPCALQDVIGTFNDGTFPTYGDANHDGYPDDPDPTVKLIMEDGGRPTYSQDFLTNYQPLNPAGANAAVPNPARDPDGLLMTGNMPTRNVAGSANKTEASVNVAPHTGEDVPLSASGQAADLFGGVYENSDVHVRLAAALRGERRRGRLDKDSPYTYVPQVTPAGASLSGL
jgi:alkaline phosphatase